MKGMQMMNSTSVFVEIGQTSIKVLRGEEGFEAALDREQNGGLTAACKERVSASLREILKRKSWQPRLRAFCAINARGVSLRPLALPPANPDELDRVLRLQIEGEFPLSPEELAWGWRRIAPRRLPANSDDGHDVTVTVVRKQTLEEYAAMLTAGGLNPVFTLGALARSWICPHPAEPYAVLDIGRNSSELIAFEDGAPKTLRILQWGGADITRAIAEKMGITGDEAEKLKLKFENEPIAGADGQKIQEALDQSLVSLGGMIQCQWTGQQLYLTGRSTRLKNLTPRLAQSLGPRVACERKELALGLGRSAAVLGLKWCHENNGDALPLTIQLNGAGPAERIAEPGVRKWAAIGASLPAAALILPYAEALLLKPRLSKRLGAVKADIGRLAVIDRELSFLEYIKANQSPYLDTVYLLARSAQPGARIDSIAMNHHGEVSLRGTLQNSQQVTDFRSKLIGSGLFSTVSVDEQTPSPDHQRLTVRMTAKWKPVDERMTLSFDPTPKEMEQIQAAAKAAKAPAAGGGMQPGMPPGMPAGMGMPLPMPGPQ